MKLHQQIREEIKEAMKAKDTIRLGVIRGLVAGFTNELVSLKRMPDGELSDDEALNVIRRGVNQRKDSIDQFTKGGRNDLADSEKAELAILETYLPAQMSKDEVLKIAEAKKNEMAITAEDVLARRTRILFLNASAAITALETVLPLMRECLNESETWVNQQRENFLELAKGYL